MTEISFFSSRDLARKKAADELYNTLLSLHPDLVPVQGGYGYLSEELDPNTGLQIPIVISITAKNTMDTAKSKAYDLEQAAQAYAARPGRQTADPVKAEQRIKDKQKAAERKTYYMTALKKWIAANDVVEMTAKEIYDQVPELQSIPLMQIGQFLKKLYEEPADDPILRVGLSRYERKKVYSKLRNPVV